MIVPEYWAEGRAQQRLKGRPVIVRRFGWSNTSQAEAQSNADARATEALQRLLAGEKLSRREPKISYNGAEGVPIREEIVSRHGETVITRNIYGARCLNTPNVLFVDIDFQSEPSAKFAFLVFCALLAGALASRLFAGYIILLVILDLIFFYPLAAVFHKWWLRLQGGAEKVARRRVDRFLIKHPKWRLRLYRTPAGLRVLVIHQVFAVSDPAVSECFRALGTDPMYVKMCQNQKCFRARVSPKPWRIGISKHMRPRPGVWPVRAESMPVREAWIAGYEAAAKGYAACTFIASLGRGSVHPEVKAVQELHDELAGATSKLPIA